jgi:hypothetical protein
LFYPVPLFDMRSGGMKSGAERLAELRARRRKEGLKPVEVWAHPDDHPAIKRYVERLVKRRKTK